MLENELDLHVNEHQKIQHHHARSTEKIRKQNAKSLFFASYGAYINCAIMAMLYTHSIENQL